MMTRLFVLTSTGVLLCKTSSKFADGPAHCAAYRTVFAHSLPLAWEDGALDAPDGREDMAARCLAAIKDGRGLRIDAAVLLAGWAKQEGIDLEFPRMSDFALDARNCKAVRRGAVIVQEFIGQINKDDSLELARRCWAATQAMCGGV